MLRLTTACDGSVYSRKIKKKKQLFAELMQQELTVDVT